MNALLRPPRLFWILGLCLLVGTAAGASWVLNRSSAQDGSAADRNREPVLKFSAFAFVDVEGGILNLHPSQRGRVCYLPFSENDEVPEGALLLSVENDKARHDLRAAKVEYESAKNLLAKAELGKKQHEELVEGQRAVVAAKKASRDAANEEHEKAKSYYKSKYQQISKFDLNIAEFYFKAAEAALTVEERKLKQLELNNPDLEVQNAQLLVQAKEIQRDKAHLALFEHDVYAPCDGTLLRIVANVGEQVHDQPKIPALQFCPKKPRILRAEVLQEWANLVEKGQSAIIEDDTRSGPQWQGKVKSVSDWFTHRRHIFNEPFHFNDVRTLECILTVDSGGRPLRIGQRVRVTFK